MWRDPSQRLLLNRDSAIFRHRGSGTLSLFIDRNLRNFHIVQAFATECILSTMMVVWILPDPAMNEFLRRRSRFSTIFAFMSYHFH